MLKGSSGKPVSASQLHDSERGGPPAFLVCKTDKGILTCVHMHANVERIGARARKRSNTRTQALGHIHASTITPIEEVLYQEVLTRNVVFI